VCWRRSIISAWITISLLSLFYYCCCVGFHTIK
jgi:hypothetical protein